MYLCYDIKGIQRFIYSVPKLKCVIGASGLIAGLDDHARGLTRDGVQSVFCAGGRGAFHCATEAAADGLEDQLIGLAHDVGLDIRIGRAEKLSDATQNADELHPFCPLSLAGFPCAASGLWPVEKEQEIHPLIAKRIEVAREDKFGRWLAGRIEDAEILELTGQRHLRFIRNVNPDPEGESENEIRRDERMARAGEAALGNRNRWAVIAMDGNDMGKQFQAFKDLTKGLPNSDERLRDWSGEMSKSLEACTHSAFMNALKMVVKDWLETESDAGGFEDCIVEERDGNQVMLVPFRPLILGGDDVVLLCHSSYALTFVETMAAEFQRLSRDAAKNATCQPLWPATGTELSISAGILFCKTTFPLHLALPYAESLLGNAKSHFERTSYLASGRLPPPSIGMSSPIHSSIHQRNAAIASCDSKTKSCRSLAVNPWRFD